MRSSECHGLLRIVRFPGTTRWLLAAAMVFWGGAAPTASGQLEGFPQDPAGGSGFSIQDQLGPFGGAPGERVSGEARFEIETGSSRGQLHVTLNIQDGWHVYSLTQGSGGLPTEVTVVAPESVRLLAPFQADRPPKAHTTEFGDVLEEYYESVTFTAPIELPDGTTPDGLELIVSVQGLVCEVACEPFEIPSITAEFAGYVESTPLGTFQDASGNLLLEGSLEPAVAVPGGRVTLTIEAIPVPPWHIYEYAPGFQPNKTLLAFRDLPEGWTVSEVTASDPAYENASLGVSYYESQVTWSLEITIPEDTPPGEYPVSGVLGYQICTDEVCDMPTAADFAVNVAVRQGREPGTVPLQLSAGDYDAIEALVTGTTLESGGDTTGDSETEGAPAEGSETEGGGGLLDRLESAAVSDDASLPVGKAILFALLGGFVLNFMPCVLPVIGLKVMSFVKQAGESRSRVFMLNMWYSLGMMSIFMTLATLAVILNLGWGQQSQSPLFNIIMLSLVFVMGLSFLGVWEIPIPGFVGTGKAAEVASQEGPIAAFVMGIVTTILAVPCSGPGLATALAWCVGKPVILVYVVFGFMGLGMAAPYIAIGIKPSLIKFLPKPGEWMETFKQSMGFLLLGTVAFILSFIGFRYMLPTFVFLVGLWFACWMVGHLSVTASRKKRNIHRVAALATAVLVGWLSFGWLLDVMDARLERLVRREAATLGAEVTLENDDQPWGVFTTARLEDEVAEGNTVIVDFTADW